MAFSRWKINQRKSQLSEVDISVRVKCEHPLRCAVGITNILFSCFSTLLVVVQVWSWQVRHPFAWVLNIVFIKNLTIFAGVFQALGTETTLFTRGKLLGSFDTMIVENLQLEMKKQGLHQEVTATLSFR